MSLKRGLIVFLVLSLTVSGIVIASSIDQKGLELILGADLKWILAAFALVLLSWCFDALRFCMISSSMGFHIPFRRGIVLTWLHYFGCAVTPMQVGGGPFQVYVLYKTGVPIGGGIAITTIRTLLSTFILSLLAPSALFFVPKLIEGHRFVQGIFAYVILLSLVVWSVFILSVARVNLLKKAVVVMALRLKRFKRFRRLPALSIYRRVGRELDGYSRNVRAMVTTGRVWFIFSIVLSVLQLLALFSVLPLLICALGLPFHYIDAVLAQAVFMFILYFVPTPGGSGVAEGGGAALFGLLVPWNIAGVMAILWRFFTEYLAIFMGAMVAIHMIGWKKAQKIIGGKGDGGEHDKKH